MGFFYLNVDEDLGDKPVSTPSKLSPKLEARKRLGGPLFGALSFFLSGDWFLKFSFKKGPIHRTSLVYLVILLFAKIILMHIFDVFCCRKGSV